MVVTLEEVSAEVVAEVREEIVYPMVRSHVARCAGIEDFMVVAQEVAATIRGD